MKKKKIFTFISLFLVMSVFIAGCFAFSASASVVVKFGESNLNVRDISYSYYTPTTSGTNTVSSVYNGAPLDINFSFYDNYNLYRAIGIPIYVHNQLRYVTDFYITLDLIDLDIDNALMDCPISTLVLDTFCPRAFDLQSVTGQMYYDGFNEDFVHPVFYFDGIDYFALDGLDYEVYSYSSWDDLAAGHGDLTLSALKSLTFHYHQSTYNVTGSTDTSNYFMFGFTVDSCVYYNNLNYSSRFSSLVDMFGDLVDYSDRFTDDLPYIDGDDVEAVGSSVNSIFSSSSSTLNLFQFWNFDDSSGFFSHCASWGVASLSVCFLGYIIFGKRG